MQEMQEMQVGSLGGEDPLEEEMATVSSILAWKIPWTVEPGGLPSIGLQRDGHNWATERWAHIDQKQDSQEAGEIVREKEAVRSLAGVQYILAQLY